VPAAKLVSTPASSPASPLNIREMRSNGSELILMGGNRGFKQFVQTEVPRSDTALAGNP